MAGYGASVRDEWNKTGDRIDLEKERELRLESMQMKNKAYQHKQDRNQEKEDYQDQQREKAQALMKEQYKQVSTNKIDEAILESGLGKYDKLNSALTNSTDTNVNLDIKKGLEASLGGNIIKVRHPKSDDPVMYSDDEGDTSEAEIAPDQVAVDYITPAGEHLTKHMSALQLGAMVGTPHRVGHQKFTEHMDGSKIEDPTPTQLAKDLSVSFDGKIEDITKNLMIAATVGKDPNAKKLLQEISEVSAKDGDSLIKALTKKYAESEDPKEKKDILAKVEEVSKLMQKVNKKKPDPKKELEQKYLDAIEAGESDKAQGYLDAHEKLYGKSKKGAVLGIKSLQNDLVDAIARNDPPEVIEKLTKQIKAYNQANQKEGKATASDKKIARIEENQEAISNLSVDNIVSGKTSQESLDKLLINATYDTKSTDKSQVFMPIFHKLSTQDREGKQVLDLSNPALRTGEITEDGAKLLKAYHSIEIQTGANASSSANKESINVISMSKSVATNAANMTREYDDLKSQGYFKDGSSLGVVQAVNDGIFRKMGDWLDGTDKGAGKAKASIYSSLSIGDEIDRLETAKIEQGGQLKSRTERKRLEELRGKFSMDTRAKWDTKTYLVLKNMLKALSGQGVTNQELESFKHAFSGGDFDSLDSIVRQLNNSSLQTMSQANLEYTKLVANGLPYTATKGMLDMRQAGDYLLRTNKDFDVNQNLSFKPTMAIPFKHTDGYDKSVSHLSQKLRLSNAQVEDMYSEVYNYGIGGSKINFFKAHKIPAQMRPKYKEVFKMIQQMNTTYEASRMVGTEVSPSPDPKTEEPVQSYTPQEGSTLADNDSFKEMTKNYESGDAGYDLQSKTSSAYGKYQIINDKFKDLAKRTGKTEKYLRTPAGQEEAMDALTEFYDEQLTDYGVPINNTNRYTVHQLGEGRAKRYFTNTLTNKDITLMWKNLGKPKTIHGNREAILKAWNNKFRKDT